MHRLSMEQALGLWSDLDDAYHGENGFGGDTAELYVFRFMPYTPTAVNLVEGEQPKLFRDLTDEAYRAANETMHALLSHYAEKRECSIYVNGETLGPWLKTADQRHRIHVRVERKTMRKR